MLLITYLFTAKSLSRCSSLFLKHSVHPKIEIKLQNIAIAHQVEVKACEYTITLKLFSQNNL